MLLIVGSNGALGKTTANFCAQNNHSFMTASHSSGADIPLDLTQPLENFESELKPEITHALICSFIHEIDHCQSHPKETSKFNVESTLNLLEILIRRNILPIFCSSDYVFAGDLGQYTEKDDRAPTTEYGQQKKAVEDFLIASGARHLIIRMGKLYSSVPDTKKFPYDIWTNISNGNVVMAATDQMIGPTSMQEIAQTIVHLAKTNLNGVFHLTPDKYYSRYEIASSIAALLGKKELVKECSIDDIKFAVKRPKNTSLVSNKLTETTGIKLSRFETSLPNLFNEI